MEQALNGSLRCQNMWRRSDVPAETDTGTITEPVLCFQSCCCHGNGANAASGGQSSNMRCVGLGNFDKTVLLEQRTHFQSLVVGLQGCKHRKGVATFSRVLLLFRKNRERPNDLRKISLLIVLWRNWKIW